MSKETMTLKETRVPTISACKPADLELDDSSQRLLFANYGYIACKLTSGGCDCVKVEGITGPEVALFIQMLKGWMYDTDGGLADLRYHYNPVLETLFLWDGDLSIAFDDDEEADEEIDEVYTDLGGESHTLHVAAEEIDESEKVHHKAPNGTNGANGENGGNDTSFVNRIAAGVVRNAELDENDSRLIAIGLLMATDPDVVDAYLPVMREFAGTDGADTHEVLEVSRRIARQTGDLAFQRS